MQCLLSEKSLLQNENLVKSWDLFSSPWNHSPPQNITKSNASTVIKFPIMELSRLWRRTLHNNWIRNSAEVSYSIKAFELRFNFKVTEPSISTWIKAMSKKWDSDIHWKAESVLRMEFGSCNHDGSNQRLQGRPIQATSVEMNLIALDFKSDPLLR